jgi:hypothetical protein
LGAIQRSAFHEFKECTYSHIFLVMVAKRVPPDMLMREFGGKVSPLRPIIP